MLQKIVFKILMIPFALLYGVGVSIYNGLYALGVLKGLTFNLPIISIGNLTVGGAGKTPHVEFLAEWLQQYVDLAILSRGYRRKSKGYIEVKSKHDALFVGDEPVQYKRKYPDITVVVSESRAFAVPKIIGNKPNIRAIIFDDGFQHRAVNPGINILLTEFNHLFTTDYLMPVGRLREFRSGYTRADMIIISKCPHELSSAQRNLTIEKIAPVNNQKVYFTKYKYGSPYNLLDRDKKITLTRDVNAILICALANSEYLVSFLDEKINQLEVIEYEDHHYFNPDNILHLRNEWSHLVGNNNVILTTEKDATRLELIKDTIQDLPIYVIPLEVSFFDSDEFRFKEDIRNYLLEFKV